MWPHDQGNYPAVKHGGKGSLCASAFCVLLQDLSGVGNIDLGVNLVEI